MPSNLYPTSSKGNLFSEVEYQNGERCTARTSDCSGVMAATEESCQEKPWSVIGNVHRVQADQAGLSLLLGPP